MSATRFFGKDIFDEILKARHVEYKKLSILGLTDKVELTICFDYDAYLELRSQYGHKLIDVQNKTILGMRIFEVNKELPNGFEILFSIETAL